MTAFASKELVCDALVLNCELRSVNHRYCDITVRLPEKIRFCESDLRSAINEKIKRGKIECILSYKTNADSEPPLALNMASVDQLLELTRTIAKKMNNPQAFSAFEVLNYPGVLQERQIDKEQLKAAMIDLVNQTITDFLKVREREGEKLAQMIESRCQKMQLFASAAKARMPEVLINLRKKIHDRILELVAEPDFDRIEQEMVFLTQKLDIAEELDRLETHITEAQRVLKQAGPIGRRLDFLMQEMNREANTLGSKSADKETTQISIELKVLIEQIREQVQNIE
jgi:uncharacterized protein (TIGR00255 family)